MKTFFKNPNFELYNENTFDVLDKLIKEKKKNLIVSLPTHLIF